MQSAKVKVQQMALMSV